MCAMDDAAAAALRDLYSDLEIDGRVLDLGGTTAERFEFPPDALVAYDGDRGALPFDDAEFDDVIVHGEVAHDAFPEVGRILKPGGHFVCTFIGGPDDAGRVKKMRGWFAAASEFGPAESDLRTSLSGAGDRLWAVWAPRV